MAKGIYSITNKKTGKRYIGSAIDINNRWQKHRKDLERGHHHSKRLQIDWKKDGAHGFEFKILEHINDPENKTITDREQYWIDHHDSYFDGYNETPIASRPFTHSDEDRKNIKRKINFLKMIGHYDPQYVHKIRERPLEYDSEEQQLWEESNSDVLTKKEKLCDQLRADRKNDGLLGFGVFIGVLAIITVVFWPLVIFGLIPAILISSKVTHRKDDEISVIESDIHEIKNSEPKKIAEMQRERLIEEEKQARSRRGRRSFISYPSTHHHHSNSHRYESNGENEKIETSPDQETRERISSTLKAVQEFYERE